ncbi:MAG: phosphonate ABC transporter, permease protein PhnE [Chloroflexota bacterium]
MVAEPKKQKVKQEDLATIRGDILRSLPKLSLHSLITAAIVVFVLGWSIDGTEASPQELARGVPTLVDFIIRLMPPEFEYAPGSERALSLPSFSIRPVSVVPKADRARKAGDEDIANLTDEQTLVYVVRLTGSSDSQIITPDEAQQYLPFEIEPATEAEVAVAAEAIETARAEADAAGEVMDFDGARIFYALRETPDDSIEIIRRDQAVDYIVEEVDLLVPYIVENGYELTVEEIGEEEVVMVQFFVHTLNPYISEDGQEIVLDGFDESVMIVAEGQQSIYTVPFYPGQRVFAKRYVLESGELLFGYPVIINSIIETAQIAVIGTVFSILLAIPFGLLAARNTTPHPIVYQVVRLFLNLVRSIPTLIYALIMVSAVGLGPFAGVLAIVVGSVGGLGRLFAESFEQVDPNQVSAVRATGAGGVQTFNYSVLPQAFPLLTTYTLITFEGNVRDSAILGIVGAGGVGFIIQKYASLFQLQRLMGAVIILAIMTTIIDRFSAYIRSRII